MKITFQELKATGTLPSPSGVGMSILKLTAREDYSTPELVRILQSDGAVTGRLLKMANSARAAGVQPVTTVAEATMRLGATAVRNIALGFSLMTSHRTGLCPAFDYDGYWSEALARAVVAQNLAAFFRGVAPTEAFVCGLLGRIGSLALASTHPGPYAEVLTRCRGRTRRELLDAEQRAFLIDQVQISLAMLLDWGLPHSHGEAVTASDERRPDRIPVAGLSGALWAASRIGDLGFAAPADRAQALVDLPAIQERTGLEGDALEPFGDAWIAEWKEWSRMLEVPSCDPPSFKELLERAQPDASSVFVPAPSPRGPVPAAAATGPAPASKPGEGMLILAVDDDRVSLRLLENDLVRAGHRVVPAANGEEALKLALELNPEVVVSDWQMPRMDGIELCRALRRCEPGREMYVLILTGSEAEDKLVEAFEAGADDYVTKPWKPRVLLARIRAARRVVDLQRQVAADSRLKQRQLGELGMLARQLEMASKTDPLTGLSNRRHAMDHLLEQWSVAPAGGLSLIMVDLDHFKQVNDEFGHDVGDLVLTETAEVLRAHVRSGEEVCRLGGEEFLVICSGADAAAAHACAERLRAALERHVIRGYDRAITASLGVAVRTPSMDRPDALLKAADLAVYEAKRSGRNRVVVYESLPVPAGSRV